MDTVSAGERYQGQLEVWGREEICGETFETEEGENWRALMRGNEKLNSDKRLEK